MSIQVNNKQYNVMKNKMKENTGITLIALVITIIVLLILAGGSIAMLTGNNGILTQAQKAKEETEEAGENENARLSELENYIVSNNVQAGEKAQDLIAIKSDGTEDTNADGSKKIIGEKVSDGNGKAIPVPSGFYYVGGTAKSGAVISDNASDKNKYKGQEVVGTDLVGNQFVFIPANGVDLKYEQDHTYDDKYQWGYTNDLGEWNDVDDGWSEETTVLETNKASVKNYGGFYVGRYEAGYPDEITDGTIVSYKNSATGKVPVSKAGVASWNLISQTTAKTASESMYSNTDSKVSSYLINSYVWDTTCKWLMNSGVVKENSQGKINSTDYGNYSNSTFILRKGTLYVKHLYLTAKENSGALSDWYYLLGGQGKYSYNKINDENGMLTGIKTGETIPLDAIKPSNSSTNSNTSEFYTADGKIEIATGSSENTRTNNIYDLAGNMWEWTTETRMRENKNNINIKYKFAVLRGGGFPNNGYDLPINYRGGNYNSAAQAIYIGFRVTLYIK